MDEKFRSSSSRAAVFLVILIACMTVVTMSVDANYQIDTEDADIREIPLGEDSGQLVLKDERIMLFWSVNEESFL